MNVLAQATFGPDPIAVANEQHADHQFGIHGWPTDLAVERLQILTNALEINKDIDLTQPMSGGDMGRRDENRKTAAQAQPACPSSHRSPNPLIAVNESRQRLTVNGRLFHRKSVSSAHKGMFARCGLNARNQPRRLEIARDGSYPPHFSTGLMSRMCRNLSKKATGPSRLPTKLLQGFTECMVSKR
jgi:hypothetical protein